MILPRQFLRMCRHQAGKPKVADSTGAAMTGRQLLLRTLILRRLLKRALHPDERFVGLLIPPSAGAVLANAALPLMGRIPVNLNYTVSSAVMNNCIGQCQIRHVLTSRRIVEKLKLQIDAQLLYLEDFRDQVRTLDKLIAAIQTYAMPLPVLERRLGLLSIQPDDLLTVIFTSGSTGDPKGVMLSHRNVSANVESISQAVQLREDDVAIGVLPFFHSYGYTATLWTVLSLAPKGVYHFSPLDPQMVGKLCQEHRVTVFMATPTFLRSYIRKCEPEELASLDLVFAAAEKLPRDVADAFESRFGVRPLEAYGCTELSPLVSVNVPKRRSPSGRDDVCEGSVGRPIPGVEARVVQRETGEVLPPGEQGMLLVRGENVMKGYLNRHDLTAEVVRDGWYVTGDIALLDHDGFIHIKDRESRFSKIGGEMVPHVKIEECLAQLLGSGEQLQAVVTAVPDSRKGERIVVVHTPLDRSPAELTKGLQECGLPNLWIPSADSFCQVEEIPVLGTGKLDLKGLKEVALARFGGQT